MSRRWALGVLLSLSACGAAGPTWEHDVRPIAEARCVACHVSGGIAPFVLDDYATARSMKDAIKVAVTERTMPPFLASGPCAEYADDQRLSEEEIATITSWVDHGAPRGTPEPHTQQTAALVNSLPRVDQRLQMPVPYTPTKSPDDYRCFVVDWPETSPKYVVGVHVVPGNARVVHHVIAFLVPPEKVPQVLDLDAAEDGPGYTCFGGPGTGRNGNGWLGSWAPGVPASMYPEGTGIFVAPGSKVVLQVHYNLSASTADQRLDQSHVEVALADDVIHHAALMPWADPDWLKLQTMNIAAGAADVKHAFSFDPTPFMGLLTNQQLRSGEGFRIYSAGAHQHQLGTKSRLSIHRATGEDECLLDIQRWDFHWQRGYRFTRAKVFHPGDTLDLECHWDNRQQNQPSVDGVQRPARDVNWGEGTGDEMCLGVFYISE